MNAFVNDAANPAANPAANVAAVQAAARRSSVAPLVAVGLSALAGPAFAASFFVTPTGVTYPIGYDGNGGGKLDVKVCLVPSTSDEQLALASRPLRNAMARWNKGEPTTANVRDDFLSSGVDFESVVLHELGHCNGLAHPNLGGGIDDDAINSTQSEPGPDNKRNLDAGQDQVFGTADDVRGDDINAFFFRDGINNPFSMPETVDRTTYTRNLAALPVGDLFPANPELIVGRVVGVPFTEAVMQHDIFFRQLNRTPSHDDVSGIRLAESGFDGVQGTSDDYDLNLVGGGRSGSPDCDILVEFEPKAGLASCETDSRPNAQANSSTLLRARIVLAPPAEFNWFFNQNSPCIAEETLQANRWRQISLPCEVGVSTSARVRQVFGDDLPVAEYDKTWVLFGFEYTAGQGGGLAAGYRKLALSDELESGAGYWMISTEDARISVRGEYHSQIDRPVFAEAVTGFGWNMVGNPFRFPTAWADARVVAADGSLLNLPSADPGENTVGASDCSRQGQPASSCTLARFAYRYDSNAQEYDLLSPLSGSLQPFDAIWAFAVKPDVEVRIAMPPAERNTP